MEPAKTIEQAIMTTAHARSATCPRGAAGSMGAGWCSIAILLLAASACSDETTTTGTAGSGGAGASGGSAVGGGGEAGGGGGCATGDTRACYDGPAGTDGIGLCTSGQQTCSEGAWGDCVGAVMPAAETCATTSDDDCDGADCVVWASSASEGSGQSGSSIAVDSAGNILVVGSFADTLDLGAGPLASAGGIDIFVAKLSGAGDVIWTEAFGDGEDQLFGLATTYEIATDVSDDVIVAGLFRGELSLGGGSLAAAGTTDGFIAKLDSSGAHQWSRRFGSDTVDQALTDVATDAVGNVYVTGAYLGTVDLGGGPVDGVGNGFLLKLSPSGDYLYARDFGADSVTTGVSVDSAGNVLVVGHFSGTVDLGGGPLGPATGDDVFVGKLDASGNHVFSQHISGPSQTRGGVVVADDDDNLFVSGTFETSVEVAGTTLTASGSRAFLAKLDSAGAHVWSRAFVAVDHLAVDPTGNLVIGATFGGQTPADFGGGPLEPGGGYDVLAAKLDSNGDHGWSKSFGAAQDQRVNGVASDGAGNVLITGFFSGTIDFGGGPVSTNGSSLFLSKLAP